jgi:hypothetical protein
MMLCLGALLLALGVPSGAAAKIPDSELRKHVRMIHRDKDHPFSEPLQLIQAANYLRPLGKIKALAVMVAYERRYAGPDGIDDVGMFHLARVLFKSDRPNGAFPPDGLFIYNRDSLPDLRKYPTYPILIFRNVPFLCYPRFSPSVDIGWPGSHRFAALAKKEAIHWKINP